MSHELPLHPIGHLEHDISRSTTPILKILGALEPHDSRAYIYISKYMILLHPVTVNF